MKNVLSTIVRKISAELIEKGPQMTEEEVKLLQSNGPVLVRQVRKNPKKPFKGMSEEDKRILLAYIVYLRQNLTTKPTEEPNDEDACKIIRHEVFKEDDKETKDSCDIIGNDVSRGKDKETKKDLTTELAKQLIKAGIHVEVNEKE